MRGRSKIRPRFLMTGQKEASFVQREVAFSLENDGGIGPTDKLSYHRTTMAI